MTYYIRNTTGGLITALETGKTDSNSTSLTLIGKNVTDYGTAQNENFIRLMENFSSPIAPTKPLEGQLWYKNTTDEIFVNTSAGFKKIGPISENSATPDITDDSDKPATTAFVHKIIPKGVILLWSGSLLNIPVGWALCNGMTVFGVVTPDLRDRFVMGAGQSYAVTETGGSRYIDEVISHSHTLSGTTTANSQSHSHSGVTSNVGDHTHIMPGDDQLSFAQGVSGWPGTRVNGFQYDARSASGGNGAIWETGSAGAHSHTFTTGNESNSHQHDLSGSTNSVGVAQVDVLNPYFALAYIIKVV